MEDDDSGGEDVSREKKANKRSRRKSFEDRKKPTDVDSALTGTTLRVYKFLITQGRPIGPRELQRYFSLSSPAVSVFHLEKLERNGLITKQETEGTYIVNRIYLKHYVLLRRHLIPQYMFYASLSTFFLIAWAVAIPMGVLSISTTQQLVRQPMVYIYVYFYGVLTTGVLSLIFWYETVKVFRKETI